MKKYAFYLFTISVLGLCFIPATNAVAQAGLQQPDQSQAAKVVQTIGLTKMYVQYHSPLAKDRKIWGDVVPYNEVWRAGANENTTVTFSTDVTFAGKNVSAGTYGLHMIPSAKDWIIILNKDKDSWGSFFYDESRDVARVNVTPTQVAHQDWLSYTFEEPANDNVKMVLRWEKLRVAIPVSVDLNTTVLASMNTELKGVSGFGWQGYNQAANFSLKNNYKLDEALKFAERSIGIAPNFTNTATKSQILAKMGKKTEADATMAKAMTMADETQLNTYGYQLMGEGNDKKAQEIFEMNVKKYPESWNVYDSLAECYEKQGNTKLAVANYKTALAKAPDGQKERITKTISKLAAK